ncbi:sodium/phosphate symporter [Halostella salina]|uniref:sodium/phosphate symporter n=1 Tax=Halostella salina TaxID=1547897 RepID=UPI000EF7E32F|nr:sodium/phosphate symporter [Halostella salina]
MSRRRPDWLLVVAVLAVGAATRLSSLYASPLPFNTDGFVFVSSAERILATDGVALAGPAAPAPDEYLFATLLAVVSEVTGVAPLYVAQALVACLATVPSLVAMAYARSLAADFSAPVRRGAAAFAGLALAVEGPYLFRSMSVNAEVFGLAVVACLALALGRTLRTERRRWLALTAALAVTVPVVHSLSAFVAGLVGTTLVALGVARRPTTRRLAYGALGTAGFWLLTFGYYAAADLPKAGSVSASLGLFLAWVVLVVALARWLDTASAAVRRGAAVAVFGAGVAVFVLNAAVAVYPGTATTSSLLLTLTLPLVVVLAAAGVGLSRLASDRGLAMFALVLGPLAAVGFALTAGRTPVYEDLVVRSVTFVHPGLVVAAAVGLAVLVRRRPAFGRVAAAAAVVAVLVSAPLPFAGLAAFPFEPVTDPAELDAATFATDRVDGGWTSDDHVALVAYNYRGAGVTDLPTTAWLRGDAPPPDCPVVARSSWKTVGAPGPTEPLDISRSAYDEWVMTGDVVYAGGADSSIVLRWEPGRCDAGLPGGGP